MTKEKVMVERTTVPVRTAGPGRRRAAGVALGVAATVIALAGPGAMSPAVAHQHPVAHQRHAKPAKPAIAWAACAPDSAAGAVGGFDCGTIEVPLDHDHARGEKITLSIVRHPATDPARRIGTLFTNPGGPGGQGTVQIPAWIQFFPAEVLAQFDVVSWDPRGIGESSGVQCFEDAGAEGAFFGDTPQFPVTAEQQGPFLQTYRDFGKACQRAARHQPVLEHMGTADVARDLDVLRRAVGEAQLRYWGLSYGTFLGATYANLFPERVGALVLDGNLAPSNWTADGDRDPSDSISVRIGSDLGAARVLDAYMDLCGEASPADCAFSGGSPAATQEKWDQLLTRLAQGPLQITYGGATIVLTYDSLLSSLSSGLDIVQPYANPVAALSIQGWAGSAPILQALWEARDTPPPADATSSPAGSTGASAGASTERSSTTSPEPAPGGEPYAGPEQSLGVTCGDAPSPRDPGYYAAAQPGIVERGNAISAVALWGDAPCTFWPIRLQDTYSGPWDTPTAGPILVVNATLDPSTPYQNAIDMADELADAHLLTVEGYGHTELLNGSSCADDHIVAYLVSGTLPPAGTVCPQDEPPFAPQGEPAA